MTDTLFWAEFWVKLAFACFLILAGAMFFKKGWTGEAEGGEKYFKIGIGTFAVFSSLTRIFFLITDFNVEGSDIFNLFWKLATASSFIAMIFIELVIETYLVKSRYVFTAISIIGTILIIVLDIPLARQLLLPVFLLIGLELFILYLYVSIKSPGTIRRRSLLMIMGLFIFMVGILLDSTAFQGYVGGFDTGVFGALLMWGGLGLYLKLNYGTY